MDQNLERLGRLCAKLHTAIPVDNSSTLARVEHKTEQTQVAIRSFSEMTSDEHDRKTLDWLSNLDPSPKLEANTLLQQPETSRWLLEERIRDWLHSGSFVRLCGPNGIGKTVLVYVSQNYVPPLRSTYSFKAQA
jgi:flagellar biosynthesis GTPase FlhF